MTKWTPIEPSDKVWILKDGRVIEEPPLEESGSKLKVRIAGRQETSVYAKDKDSITVHAVRQAALRANSDILACVRKRQEPYRLPQAEFNMEDRLRKLRIMWMFRHESMPLTARITVSLEHRYGDSYKVRAYLSFTEIGPDSETRPKDGSVSDQRWHCSMPNRTYTDQAHRRRDQLNEPGLHKFFTEQDINGEAHAVRAVRDHIDEFDAWEEVRIPNLHDPDELEWITLGFEQSNLEGETLSLLSDYLNTAPLIAEIAEKYKEMQVMLRKLGIVATNHGPNDFQAALNAREDALQVTLKESDDGNFGHSVILHLMSGTLSVRCNASNSDDAADTWTLARFEAEMRGELESFLNHCKTAGAERHRTEVIDSINEKVS